MVLPDDIPVARRQHSRPRSPSIGQKRQIQVWAAIVGVVVVALLAMGALFAMVRVKPPTSASPVATSAEEAIPADVTAGASGQSASAAAEAATSGQSAGGESGELQSSQSDPASASQLAPETQPDEPESVLGHFAYEEAPETNLEVVGYYGDRAERMQPVAAKRFVEMLNAAATAGITLMPVSGYRSIEVQEQLFFQVAQSRALRPQERALVSAPPGHSEHHTGYAIDIADAAVPGATLNESFETTPAFRWLEANAARYGFELSFPRDNEQGVTYEPWHWRFVGDRPSLETFYGSNSRPQPVATE